MEITSEVVHVAEFDRIVTEQIKIAAVKTRDREREREREREQAHQEWMLMVNKLTDLLNHVSPFPRLSRNYTHQIMPHNL